MAFQQALWAHFSAPARALPQGETVVCRCEEVCASTVRSSIAAGALDIGAIKRATRLGMGRCQGRYCQPAAMRLLAEAGVEPRPERLLAPQIPVRPLRASRVLREVPEWKGHRESLPGRRPRPGDRPPLTVGKADLVVVGGGVTGISAALEGARRGLSVVCLERGWLAAEASGGNAGSLHLQLLSWDFGGGAAATGNPPLQTLPLQRDSIDLWREIHAECGATFEMAVTGGMMVAENEEQIAFLEKKVRAEASVGIAAEVIGSERIHSIAPAVSPRMVAAAWCPGEGKIDPLGASLALIRMARKAGAVFEEQAPVVAIERDGEGFCMTTPSGRVGARKLVLATGGWSGMVGRMMGIDIPVRGAPLQMIVTEPAPPLVPCLLAHADRHLTMKQTVAGTLLIGGAWTARTGADGQVRNLRESVEGNLWVAVRTVPAVAGLDVTRSWAAMNIDLDGAPLISPLPGWPGAVVAATANGYTLGPLMGREAARMAIDGTVPTALAPFTIDRFRTRGTSPCMISS